MSDADLARYDPPITGAVCRVEAQWSHSAFCDAARPQNVMLDIVEARKLIKRGETADSYFPEETTVITTSTTRDEKLDLIPWEENDHGRLGEIDIVREFGPTYHIPTDYSDYSDIADEQRLKRVIRCMEGTEWMQEQLADTETSVLPLLKGCRPIEREQCYEKFDAIDAQQVALYVAPQFNAGGRAVRRIVDDLDTITEETDRPLLLIGLLSPNSLARMPEQVVAAAGQKAWREPVAPRKENATSIRRTYDDLESRAADALDVEAHTIDRSIETETASVGL